jgi:hypothetical protein
VLELVNPTMLWATAAIAIPIAIHLLLRRRPRAHAWAAMAWLAAAARIAQRNYRLTQLLLLLLRCLILILLALAWTRPSIPALGQGPHLVLILDGTASMGATGRDAGPLAAAIDSLRRQPPSFTRTSIFVADPELRLLADGPSASIVDELDGLQASHRPGGLDDALADASAVLTTISGASTVVLASDYRQDRGEALVAALQPHVRRVTRWRLGDDQANAAIIAVDDPGALSPGLTTALDLSISGTATNGKLRIDDGALLPITLTGSGNQVQIPLPPLEAGHHQVTLALDDDGLRYDSVLEFPLLVAARRPATVIGDEHGHVAAALRADIARRIVDQVGSNEPAWPLPERGLAVVVDPLAGRGHELAGWIERGGILWTTTTILSTEPALAKVINPADNQTTGHGRLTCPLSGMGPTLNAITIGEAPLLAGEVEQEPLLSLDSGGVLVAARRQGRGAVILSSLAPAAYGRLIDSGAFPLWVRRCVDHLRTQLDSPLVLHQNDSAPNDLSLERNGERQQLSAGATITLAPGLWHDATATGRDLVVLAATSETVTATRVASRVATSLNEALPSDSGQDWGPLLLALTLLLVLIEGRYAARAGRSYGG